MDSTHVSANWFEVGSDRRQNPVYFRKENIYDLCWDVDIDNSIVTAAPFGGPIAFTRNPEKAHSAASGTKPELRIFSSSGVELVIPPVEWRGACISAFGWSQQEELVVVGRDSSVSVFSVLGKLLKSFYCVEGSASVVMAKVYNSGVVCLTNRYEMWAVSLEHTDPIRMAVLDLNEPPACMEVIPPEFSRDERIEVLLAPNADEGNGTVLVVTEDGVRDCKLRSSPILQMALSPDGLLVVTFNSKGVVQIFQPDFRKAINSFSASNDQRLEDSEVMPPVQLAWCGKDSVVAVWWPEEPATDSFILVVGPRGDFERQTVEGPAILVSEVDGVRIQSRYTCDFMQRVPDATVDVFGVGSIKPASKLYDAWSDYELMKASSVKNVRHIGDDLPLAVDMCTKAAGHELNSAIQVKLLRAAAYGKCFLDSLEADRFVDTCRSLRVLNAVKDYKVGIPLTVAQYEALTQETLIQRLIQRHCHLLAYNICEYLSIKNGKDNVLAHWACAKVRCDLPDSIIKDVIVEKLSKCVTASFSSVARDALSIGKKDLAMSLLEHEPKASDQVPLLLDMGEDKLALERATLSGDHDLLCMVVIQLKSREPAETLFRTLAYFPQAFQILLSYCEEQDSQYLEKHLDVQGGASHSVLTRHFVKQYYASADMNVKMKMLKKAQTSFTQRQKPVDAKCAEEQIKLIQIQMDLERKTGKPVFLGLSVNETIRTVFMQWDKSKHDEANKEASKIVKEFSVPPKRFWWVKLRALVERKDWDSLEKFAKEKSPIGYLPFVEECTEAGQLELARKIQVKVTAKERESRP